MHADLIIVGAGMVGSTLALALKDSGLNIVLVDRSPLTITPFSPEQPFEPRVSALSIASQRILQHVNAWPAISTHRASPYRDMYVWDGSGTGKIHFSASSVHADVLGHIVENRVTQDALLEQLHHSDISLLPNSSVEQLRHSTDGWVMLLNDDTEIRSPLVIAADGANSAIRSLTGCATREWDYLHHAIVTSVRCEKPHQETAWQRFTDEGPLALLPLQHSDDKNWCSIVWSVPEERAKQLMALDDAAFCVALGQACEHRLGVIEHADQRYSIPLRQRHAKRYVEPGLALIGDAAHSIHPLAGQGVNLGFLDAAVLAQVLLHAYARGEDIASERVLSRFERRRMPENLAMMAAMETFQHLFQADALALRWLRNSGLQMMDNLDQAKAVFIRHALGLGANLPDLAQP